MTTAMMGNDPDVEHLRGRIGKNIRERLIEALGPSYDPTYSKHSKSPGPERLSEQAWGTSRIRRSQIVSKSLPG